MDDPDREIETKLPCVAVDIVHLPMLKYKSIPSTKVEFEKGNDSQLEPLHGKL